MGYQSRWRGGFEFFPPVYDVIGLEKIFDENSSWYGNLIIDSDVRTVSIEGVEYRAEVRMCGYLELDGSGKVYSLEQLVNNVLVWVMNNTDSNITGEVEVFGEESTDIWRVRVVDGKVVREDAKVLWPDGTEVISNY